MDHPSLTKGSLSNRYKFRTTGSHYDNDIETTLALDIGNPNADRVSGSLMAGGLFDLDPTPVGSPFRNAYDALNDKAVGRLYHAYLDAKDIGLFQQVRTGRQHRFDFETLYFDGLNFESKPFSGFTLDLFGGVPVHLFENQIGFDAGDWLAGGALQWNPLSNFQSRLDYAHVKDSATGFRASSGDREDNLLGATFWWDPSSHVGLLSRFTSFSDQIRDVTTDVNLRFPEKELNIRFQFFRLLLGYDIRALEWDTFGIIGTYKPYTELSLTVNKGLGKHFAIDTGVTVRFLDDSQIASAFNHGFERTFLTLSTFDLPIDGMTISATGDYYRGEDNTLKNNIFGGSFSVAQKLLQKKLELSGGTAFYLYRYNLFTGNESENVQSYFSRLKWVLVKNLEARIGYEFENNSFDNYHSVDSRLIWSF